MILDDHGRWGGCFGEKLQKRIFGPEWVAWFGPESLAYFTPEWVA